MERLIASGEAGVKLAERCARMKKPVDLARYYLRVMRGDFGQLEDIVAKLGPAWDAMVFRDVYPDDNSTMAKGLSRLMDVEVARGRLLSWGEARGMRWRLVDADMPDVRSESATVDEVFGYFGPAVRVMTAPALEVRFGWLVEVGRAWIERQVERGLLTPGLAGSWRLAR